MPKSRKAVWITILTSGLGVALLTFVANKAWEVYRHKSVGPEYVDASIRIEDNKVFVFLRNNSDEPLDLQRAKFSLDEPGLVSSQALGAYPDISKLYTATATSGSTNLEVVNKELVVTLHITQAIAPKAADHFGVTLVGLVGPLDLSKARIRAEFEDLKGNKYVATR
jgi:hypothetical protein